MYNSLRKLFRHAAVEASQAFARQYDSYGDIDTVIDKAFNDGMALIVGAIDKIVINGVLIRQKIYDVDARRFFVDFYGGKYFHWDKAFEEVQDKYWVGVGCGISGALTGAAKAGALNMASGALHGLFNAGAKVLSMADENRQKA